MSSQQKSILSPVRESLEDHNTCSHQHTQSSSESETDSDDDTFRGNASHSDFEPSSEGVSSEDSDINDEQRRYPARERRNRVIPGAVPWSAIPNILSYGDGGKCWIVINRLACH